DTPRLAHGAWTLARAGRLEEARRAVDFLARSLEEGEAGGLWLRSTDESEPPSIAEVAFLLLALCELGHAASDRARRLARTLWASIDVHGRLATHRGEPRAADAFQDYYPGEALLALARAAETGAAPA